MWKMPKYLEYVKSVLQRVLQSLAFVILLITAGILLLGTGPDATTPGEYVPVKNAKEYESLENFGIILTNLGLKDFPDVGPAKKIKSDINETVQKLENDNILATPSTPVEVGGFVHIEVNHGNDTLNTSGVSSAAE